MKRLKNPLFLLVLILIAYLSREIFLATVFPMFTGQDEARHYNTVQWLSSERNFSCLQTHDDIKKNRENLGTYRFSEEIRQTSETANLAIWRDEDYTKPVYDAGPAGTNESLIQSNPWSKDMPLCPPDIVSSSNRFSLFHWMGSNIEKLFGNESILVRFYLIRLLSVLLGAITLLLAYFAAVEAGFARKTGLLMSFILSLQPALSIYTTNINYDVLLIPFFALFFYAGLRILKRSVTPANAFLLLASLMGALLTKGTALVLGGGLAYLMGWMIYNKRSYMRKVSYRYWLLCFVAVIGLGLVINAIYSLGSVFSHFSFPSLFEYLSKSLPKIDSSSKDFWGEMSWNEAQFGSWFVYFLWFIEALALYGSFCFFRRKSNPPFLPSKEVALFCLVLLVSLQIGIRFYDWQVFQSTGSLILGTPGRYFLPTLLPELILIAIGIGALVRKERLLERILSVLALLMLGFYLYTVLLIVIPRFYL